MRFLLLITSIFLWACSDNDSDNNVDTNCFSFDIRQCQTDAFADQIDENASLESRENSMETWLESEGFEVTKVKLVENFHEFVCEACDSCPQGDRYYVSVVESDSTLGMAEELRLLSFEETDCSVFQ